MRLVIATPLYPPDIAPSAAYVKELARRLSGEHEVTIIAYGEFPELLPGVTLRAVSRAQPLLLRLFAFHRALAKALQSAEGVIIENGSSVELPALLRLVGSPRRIVFELSDTKARERAGFMRRVIERLLAGRAHVVKDQPVPRPEILPFAPYPEEAFKSYEHSWEEHLKRLRAALAYGN